MTPTFKVEVIMPRSNVAATTRKAWSLARILRLPSSTLRQQIEDLLAGAGNALDGGRPWGLHVHGERFFPSVLWRGSLGLGESYVAGWWDCESLDELVSRALRAGLHQRIRRFALRGLTKKIFANPGRRGKAFEIGKQHYDIGNDLFERMLDRRMIYSCALWGRGARTLDQVQLTCAGGFRSRYNQLWQVVLSPRGWAGGYARVS